MKFIFIGIVALLFVSCEKPKDSHAEGEWIKGTKQEQIEIKERQFGGFGSTMIEVGYRYNELYWAGQNENWDYAEYQLEDMENAMKKGFERRPNREKNANHFMKVSLPEVMKAVQERSKAKFDKSFEELRISCTACHAMENLPSFVVETPKVNTSVIGK